MKKSFEEAKTDIVLTLAIMAFLATFCFVFYTGLFKDDNMDINTNIELQGGQDIISKKLQDIIPYLDTTDTKYETAYQNKTTNYSNIDNDIYLTKAYLSNTLMETNNITKALSYMYGSSIFLVHKSFNVNGSINCVYDQDENTYACEELEYNKKLYKAARVIENISINNDDYYLLENVLFYTEETFNDSKYYVVYEDSTYTQDIATFTTKDIEKANTDFNTYIKENYEENFLTYRTKFTSEDTNYIWKKTERLS